jgi:hypothetical protein
VDDLCCKLCWKVWWAPYFLGPYLLDLVPVLSCGGIFLTGTSLATKRKVSLLNVYGPCQERKKLWEKVDRVGLLAVDDLIMAGDLNLTTSSEDIWGESAQTDSLAGFFKEIFSKNKLVDVAPAEVVPTWRNGRSGSEGISKRLERFYVGGGRAHYFL